MTDKIYYEVQLRNLTLTTSPSFCMRHS